MSPIEFLIYVNDLPAYIKSYRLGLTSADSWLGALGHADDFALLAEVIREAVSMLQVVDRYTNAKQLTLSASNTKILIVRT